MFAVLEDILKPENQPWQPEYSLVHHNWWDGFLGLTEITQNSVSRGKFGYSASEDINRKCSITITENLNIMHLSPWKWCLRCYVFRLSNSLSVCPYVCVFALVNTILHKVCSLMQWGTKMNWLNFEVKDLVMIRSNIVINPILGQFLHHRTLNYVSLDWFGCVVVGLVQFGGNEVKRTKIEIMIRQWMIPTSSAITTCDHICLIIISIFILLTSSGGGIDVNGSLSSSILNFYF